MRKMSCLFAVSVILSLALSSCGGAPVPSAGGDDLSQPPVAVLPDEAYEAVDYMLYPCPEGAFVGDVMPFVTDDGELELYYLYDTTHNGQGYHPIYKYSTPDLVGYEDHGMMLEFGLMSDPDPALGTGSVVQGPDGLYHLFYTGHNDSARGDVGKECVMHATSADRETWDKQGVVFYAPEGCSKDDFRDPEVFWVEEEGCYWMLVAARRGALGGVVLKYTSADLESWELDEPIFAPGDKYMCECPDIFRMGDKWYLTYSWDCVTYYAVADSIGGPYVAPENNILDGKGLADGNGFVFYAAKAAEMDGATYLCGWVGRAGLTSDSGVYQWAGNVMVHELVQRDDGTLGVRAPKAFDEHFTADEPVQAAAVRGKVEIDGSAISLAGEGDLYALADMGTRPGTMMLECDVTLDEGACAGFAFGGTDGSWGALCLDAARGALHFEGCDVADVDSVDPGAITLFDFSRSETHHVRLVCENEIVVLYVDDEKALSSRITRSTEGGHIGVFADGGSASFENLSISVPA